MAPKKKEKIKKENVVVKDINEKKSSSFSSCWLVMSIIVLFLAAGTYHFYISYVVVPELPKFDLNVMWGPHQKVQDTSIRPYRIVFSESMQENIRRKFEAYRRAIHIKSLNESSSYGINSDVLGQIFAHWQFKYKYGQRARYLNKFNHFKTNIQGLDMHFVHVKPEVKNNVKIIPLLLVHGWPGSVKDFYEAIPLLTTVRPGYDFVFEVIAPSLPGLTYSQAAVRQGLTTYQVAIILRNLMERIGHKQFYVQGGGIGHIIGTHLATIFPNQVLGFHTNFPINYSKLAHLTLAVGAVCPKCVANDLAEKIYPLSEKLSYYLEETGFLHLQSTKPDTIGIALQDSPLGLAAYVIERYLLFTDPNNKDTYEGGLPAFNITDLIDNVMMYWSTGSITSSLRLFKESLRNRDTEEILSRIPTPVPTWGLRSQFELMHQPDFILRWKYPNLVGTTNLDVGGHYLAFEKPVEFTDDVFKAVGNFLNNKRK